ncbi:MAG: sn-glycerol-3-phosphate ABC transporter ATP-binding protein UgpC [Sporolactobacillus sp.]|nr:sn-glycerol-3-phosphate ABC transporter ATP-binding protein UgpC [Sporolactobacillus sp.]
MADLSLQHIYKIYENSKEPAVSDFTLDIADKEFIVFVGPSGCGKSTTLRMIAGLEEITKGELYIDGKLVNDVAPKDRDIAMVFQNYALYPHMSVYDNMAFGLKLRKIPKAEIKKRVDHAAGILGIKDYLDRKPKALSGGQRQRVALGRALVRNAKVFLLDEPLSNLDAKLRVQMRGEISALHQRLKATMVYVTHDQTEAMTMATRIVVMSNGLIQQVGTPREVYDHPKNLFVGGFIGSPPMNFFDGKLDGNHFIGDDIDVIIPEGKLKILRSKNFADRPVILGIRPEDIHDEPVMLKSIPNGVIHATVRIAELTGAEFILHSQVGHHQFVARVNARTQYHAHEEVNLALNLNKIHFFDPDTQQSLIEN